MTDPVEDVIARLVDSGLDDKEARIAVALSGHPPLKASEIGELVGVSRMDAYNTLKRLQEKAMILATIDKPMRFVGRPISEIFQQLIKREEAELRRLRTHLDELQSNESQAFISAPPQGEAPGFTVIKDRQHIHASLERMVDDAEDEIILMLGRWGILHLVRTGVLQAINNAAMRGVRVRVIANLHERNDRFFNELDDIIEIRHTEESESGGAMIDQDVAIQMMAVESNPVGRGREDSALIIESRGFVRAQRELIDSMWANAIDIKSARSRILKGKVIEPLRISLGEGSFYQRLREGILSSMDVEEDIGPGFTNAILRREGEYVPHPFANPALDMMGVKMEDILRNIGRRIGEEIAMSLSSVEDDEEFRSSLKALWQELKMGELILDGNPPESVVVKDAGSCGGRPSIGGIFCHLDEGILEGVIEHRYDIPAKAVERVCTTDGDDHCHFDIQFTAVE